MKVLIVDDEKPIRQWFGFCIEKAKTGWEIVGDAANGKEALEIFMNTLPDLVITDIKMPVMDGIELMKQIKAIAPTTDIVILTCYTDFAFAKEAVKQGAVEYLLKAEVQDQDIFDLLNRIEKKRKEQGITQKALEIRNEILKNAFMDDLMSGRIQDQDAIQSRLTENKITLDSRFLFAMALHPDPAGRLENDFQLVSGFRSEHSLNLAWFRYETDKLLILLGNLKANPSQTVQSTDLLKLGQELQRNVPGSVGISKVYHSIADLPTACRQACNLVRLEFFKGKGRLFVPEEIASYSDGCLELERLQKKVFQEIERKELASISETIVSVFDRIEQEQIWDLQFIRRICGQTLEVLYAKVRTNTEIPITNLQRNIAEEIGSQESFASLKKWMLATVTDIMELLTRSGEKPLSLVMKAVQYIEAHYQDPLSLQEVASHVHLNPNYFCQLFKTETGENFSSFLIRIRLQKAENLLKTTDLKAYEVAEQVGYPNLSYFSRLFKKYKGKSPFEYRNSNLP